MSTFKHQNLSPTLCRAARAALKMGVRELAKASGITAMTVTRFENEQVVPRDMTKAKIVAVFEAKGVSFEYAEKVETLKIKKGAS